MRWMFLIGFCVGWSWAAGQANIQSRVLQVSTDKTSNLIFPASILSIDRGSEKIIVQKSTTNILRVKADSTFADTTNLTVITTDGRLYTFLVSYHSFPSTLTINLSGTEPVLKDTAIVAVCEKIIKDKSQLFRLQYKSGGIEVRMLNLYTEGKYIYCKLKMENRSSFAFEAERFHVALDGNGSLRRSSVQEKIMEPAYIHGNGTCQPLSSQHTIIVLPVFGTTLNKYLLIGITEKNGDRNLLLKIKTKYLVKAKIVTR